MIGQPLSQEILGILEDYEVSQVHFFDHEVTPHSIFKIASPHCLMIINREAISKQLLRTILKFAKSQKIEVLQFNEKVYHA